MKGSRDLAGILERLPSGRAQAWGLCRLLIVVIAANAVWREGGLALWVHEIFTAVTSSIINASRPDDPLRILSAMRSEYLFNLFVPVIFFALLPLRRWVGSFSRITLATIFVAGFDLFIAVVRNKWAYAVVMENDLDYYMNHAKPTEQLVLMTVSISLVPILSIVAASFMIAGLSRAMARKRDGRAEPVGNSDLPKVGRNQPCPCGSGLKYKRCCGAPAKGSG
jgi:hypothetical protein